MSDGDSAPAKQEGETEEPLSEVTHSQAEKPDKPASRLPTLLMLLLLPCFLLLGAVSFKTLENSAASMAFPYQLDPEEGFILEQAIRLAQGQSIYTPVDQYPLTIGNYPPVYPMLYAGGVILFGPRLEAGRALVMSATVLILSLLALMILRDTDRTLPTLLGPVLFMATWDVNYWIGFARVDLPAIAFGLAGLLAITSRRRGLGLALGVLLFLLGGFTKQTQVVAPFAALCGMVWRKEYCRAGLFCLLMAGFGILTFSVLNLVTRGEFFRHTVLYNINEMVAGQTAVWLRHVWRFNAFKLIGVIVAGVGLLVLLSRTRKDSTGHRNMLPEASVFLLFSGLFALSSIGKAGAAANYLLEFQAALALFLGLAAGHLGNEIVSCDSVRGRRMVLALHAALVVLLTLHSVSMARVALSGQKSLFTRPPSTSQVEIGARVELELVDLDGDLLCVDPIFTIRRGREVLYQPFIMSQLAREGKWDESLFVAELRAARFRAILAKGDFRNRDNTVPGFTPTMQEAIRGAYEFEQRIAQYYLFVPKGSARDVPQPMVATRVFREDGRETQASSRRP